MLQNNKSADKHTYSQCGLFKVVSIASLISGCLLLFILMGPWIDTVYSGCEKPVDSKTREDAETQIREGVAGSVKNLDGHPVAGVLITPRPLENNAPPIPEIAIFSDDEGRFGWPLCPASYLITATKANCQSATQKTVVEQGKVLTVDFVMECHIIHTE